MDNRFQFQCSRCGSTFDKPYGICPRCGVSLTMDPAYTEMQRREQMAMEKAEARMAIIRRTWTFSGKNKRTATVLWALSCFAFFRIMMSVLGFYIPFITHLPISNMPVAMVFSLSMIALAVIWKIYLGLFKPAIAMLLLLLIPFLAGLLFGPMIGASVISPLRIATAIIALIWYMLESVHFFSIATYIKNSK